MTCTTLLIADHHPVFLQGLIKSLEPYREFNIVACCSDGKSCIDALRSLRPDLAVLAASMPDLTACKALSTAKSEHLSTRLIFFTESDEELVVSTATNGYSIISKEVTPDVLVRSLRQVAQGKMLLSPLSCEHVASRERAAIAANALMTLTEREHQIMRLVSEGLSNKEIGKRLSISDGTIKVHLHHIFQKLDINNRTVLAALAIFE
ncbi:response regulator transcription factor [Bradyrhizobium sp. BWA-3-5]|uniref:response regulator transcription factor n=1 Tax=Bradyrhizobium sp. BWA-3-5 TaxID=3080013 RepID=UPI00293E61AB|nr:response regulator transcription factor [Bradyrhizobium sp. BWA-3-5]WOH67891.1 response regulator transcription factor [Bradyrhizobium sp. BWA-3-5]